MSVTVTPPRTLVVGDSSIEIYTAETMDEIERDPRGVLLMWEPPKENAKYIMGLDPTHGITGWSRGSRSDNDHKTDNAAIEVFQVDALSKPMFKEVQNPTGRGYVLVPDIDPATRRQRIKKVDLQVAEFAAPCDAVEIARVANVIGRIYAGDSEDQCELIFEAWPGPGVLTTQELIRLGYGNLWMWEYIDNVVEETNRPGWRSSIQSQKLLWQRSRRHLMNRQACIRSKYLLEEYANAEIDLEKMRARAAYGYHDDRFQAANMCFWAGHKWCYDAESTVEPVRQTREQDYQTYAPTLGDHQTYREYIADLMSEWE